MGGSGGGGSSGKVDYPSYLKKIHADWLAHTTDSYSGTPDTINASITDTMNDALGASPFVSIAAYNPSGDIVVLENVRDQLGTTLGSINTSLQWANAVEAVLTSIRGTDRKDMVDDVIDAFNANVDFEVESVHIPRFERGMQSINAVISSDFIIGRAIIEEGALRRKAEFAASIWLDYSKEERTLLTAWLPEYTRLMMAKADIAKASAGYSAEVFKGKVVAMKEYKDQEARFGEADAKWDLEVYQYGANLLASISGAALSPTQKSSPVQSALGGAVAGGGAGYMLAAGLGVSGPVGAGIGAVLGAGLSLL